ncbi:hypothetical protein [Paenibacillus barcinonensis]|nr:hypothetical protein [Paenibacillus barcinonensis]
MVEMNDLQPITGFCHQYMKKIGQTVQNIIWKAFAKVAVFLNDVC